MLQQFLDHGRVFDVRDVRSLRSKQEDNKTSGALVKIARAASTRVKPGANKKRRRKPSPTQYFTNDVFMPILMTTTIMVITSKTDIQTDKTDSPVSQSASPAAGPSRSNQAGTTASAADGEHPTLDQKITISLQNRTCYPQKKHPTTSTNTERQLVIDIDKTDRVRVLCSQRHVRSITVALPTCPV